MLKDWWPPIITNYHTFLPKCGKVLLPSMAKLPRLLLGLGLPLFCWGFSRQSSFAGQPHARLTSSPSLPAAAATLSMHLGHSHSHHHHHGHNHQDHQPNSGTSNTPSAMIRPTSISRKISLVVFAACVVLAPRLVMKKSLSRAHGATFVMTCVTLGMMDQIRGGFVTILEKLRVRCAGDSSGMVRYFTFALRRELTDNWR